MKVWASASAMGLSLTYLAGCSAPPQDDNGYVPGGSGSGMQGQSGNNTPGAGNGSGGASAGNTGNGGQAPGAGNGGAAPVAGGGAGPGGGTGGIAPGGKEVACPANVLGHCEMGATYPEYPGYTLNLVEDFPVALDLNNDPIFTWSDGSPQDGQTGFREEQIKFADGKMILVAEAPAGCAPKTTNAGCIPPRMSYGEAFDPNATAQVQAMGVWSGELRSKYNNFRYGRYEAKFKAPMNTAGDYLSTLFIFRNPKNSQWREIDVELEPNHMGEICGNIVNADGAQGYPGGSSFCTAQGGGYNVTQEHVYAFNWEANKVEWFIDGVSVHTDTGAGVGKIPTVSAKIMMNLWVFSGTAFGDGSKNTYPMQAEYDYFRFYKSANETTYPCSPAPGCLPAGDKTKSAQNNPKEVNYGQ